MNPSCDGNSVRLNEFLEKSGRAIKDARKDKRPPTHLRMTGGKYHVADEDMETFFTACGREVEKGNSLFCLVEVNTPVTRLHFDVDFPEQVSDGVLEDFCLVLHAAVSEYFRSEHLLVACVTFTDLREKARTGKGLHAIFPSIFVDADTAKTIYAGVLARCEQKMSCFKGSWGEILDFSVLRENGSLRMVGFDKAQKCATCLNTSARTLCNDCDHTGHLLLKKIYWPWKVFPEGARAAQMTFELANVSHAVKLCSIRSSQEPSKDFFRPAGAPVPVAITSKGAKLKKQTGERALKGDLEQLEVADDVLGLLAEAIHSYDEKYKELVVAKVTRKRAERGIFDVLWVVVRGFNERFCLNKGSEHKSSNIYFQVSHKGLAQKCWCRKKAVGRSGDVCSRFTGAYKTIPPAVFTGLLQREASATKQLRSCSSFGPSSAENERPKKRKLEAPQSYFVGVDMYYFITPDPF